MSSCKTPFLVVFLVPAVRLDFAVLSVDWILVIVAWALAGTEFNSDLFRAPCLSIPPEIIGCHWFGNQPNITLMYLNHIIRCLNVSNLLSAIFNDKTLLLFELPLRQGHCQNGNWYCNISLELAMNLMTRSISSFNVVVLSSVTGVDIAGLCIIRLSRFY